jgi:dolichol kinase
MYYLAEGPLFFIENGGLFVLGVAAAVFWQLDMLRRAAALSAVQRRLELRGVSAAKRWEIQTLQWIGSFGVVQRLGAALSSALRPQLRAEEESGLYFSGTSFFLAGSMLSLAGTYMLPGSSMHCCTLSVLALAVGDPVGALVGGQLRVGPRASWGKSLIGSTAHCIAVALTLAVATGSTQVAVPLAVASAVAEFIAGSPLTGFLDDNILVPAVVHLVAILLLNAPTIVGSIPGPTESLLPAAASPSSSWRPSLGQFFIAQLSIVVLVLIVAWTIGVRRSK